MFLSGHEDPDFFGALGGYQAIDVRVTPRFPPTGPLILRVGDDWRNNPPSGVLLWGPQLLNGILENNMSTCVSFK
jgi:hypothetical protein